MGLWIFLGLALICSVVLHVVIKRYYVASVVSAITVALLFQIIAAIQLGYMDPFAPIAFGITAVVTFGMALVIGLPFYGKADQRPN